MSDLPAVRICVGAAGTGKTQRLRSLGSGLHGARWRSVVLDVNGEWGAQGLPGVPLQSVAVDGLIVALRDKAPRLIVVPAPRKVGEKEACALVDRVADAVLDAPYTALILPEAGTWLPNNQALPPAVRALCTRWRHANVALFLDFQKFALVSATARDAARVVYCFPASNPRDAKVYQELGGPKLVAAVDECAARFHQGEPGWHVELALNAPIPTEYKLKRLPPV